MNCGGTNCPLYSGPMTYIMANNNPCLNSGSITITPGPAYTADNTQSLEVIPNGSSAYLAYTLEPLTVSPANCGILKMIASTSATTIVPVSTL